MAGRMWVSAGTTIESGGERRENPTVDLESSLRTSRSRPRASRREKAHSALQPAPPSCFEPATRTKTLALRSTYKRGRSIFAPQAAPARRENAFGAGSARLYSFV
jgi:hypothetical protein